MTDFDVDVAVVGAGPTGLTVCNLLGAAGVRTVLIERNASTVSEPRAVSIDDESLRTMQSLGLLPELLRDIAPDYGSHYLTPSGKIFLKVEPKTREFGHPRRNAFLQPKLENTLRQGLARYACVQTWFETSCETVEEDAEGVTLGLLPVAGEARRIRVRYVVGSDGGRSMLRKVIGATLGGATYQQRWLIVDLASTVERFRQTRVLCNPDRPAICLPGPHGTRRYEFMLRDGETDELAQSDVFVRDLLAKHGPDRDAPVVRQQAYTFHARMVDRWASNRIFLAGDAAHLTPPFAGQGMNSGVRDAHNIGWKLAQVVHGRLGPGLLRSYAEERPAHAWALIQLAVKMGRVMMPKSRLHAWVVQTGFRAARVLPQVQAYFAEMKYKPKPFYQKGFLSAGITHGIVGRMLPQPVLELQDGARALMDDVIGQNFAVIAYGYQAQAVSNAVAALDPGLSGPVHLAITPRDWNMQRDAGAGLAGRDVEGRLAVLTPAAGGTLLLLLRPDRYVALAMQIDSSGQVAEFAREVREMVAATGRPSHEGPARRG